MDFATLRRTRSWRDMPGCPGRSVLVGADPALDVWVRRCGAVHPDTPARDVVWLARFAEGGGGVLSYERPDGSFLHTLNTEDGLRRKAAALGVALIP